jgi:integrase
MSSEPTPERPVATVRQVFAVVDQMPERLDEMVRWRDVVADAGIPGLRFHDLRPTGNTLAAPCGSTRELMSRMGHSSTRAAIIYEHAAEERDRVIADALDAMLVGHVPATDDRNGP